MSDPKHEERRLGLLQCPKAASRGWGNNATINSAPHEDDEISDRHDGSKAENREALSEVVQNDSSIDLVEDLGEFESSLEGSGATDARVATAGEPSELAVNLENNDALVETLHDSHTDNDDEAAVPRKRLRADEGYVEGGKDVSKISSCMDVLVSTDQRSQSELSGHKCKEGEVITSNADLSRKAGEEPRSNPIEISMDYESDCRYSYSTSLESSPTNEKSTHSFSNTSCTKKKSHIVSITSRCNINKVDTIINVGTISGRAKIELISLDPLCAHNQSMTEEACSDLALDVFGYRLSHSSRIKSIEIHRPNWMNALPLSLVCPAILEERDFSKKLFFRIQSLWSDKEITKDDSCYYSSHPEESFKLTFYNQTEMHHGNAAGIASERNTGAIFISDPWRNAADKITDVIQLTYGSKEENISTKKFPSNNDRILVCGAKGVGKSTFLRYMTNRMLSSSSFSKESSTSSAVSNCHCLAILDLDSGQPELSPPGLLTLSIVSRPILSDPPMHMVCDGIGRTENGAETQDECSVVEKVVASYFFGDTSSKSDPDRYILIANKLLQKYQELISEACEQSTAIPLLVNSDGWVKGLGYEILSAIIGICNPAHIVQIQGNTKAKSFDITQCQPGENGSAHSRSCIYAIQSFDKYSSVSFEEGNTSHHRGSLDSSQYISTGPLLATASDHRSHRLCAYFLQGCNKMSNLRSGIVGDDSSVSFHKEKGLVDPSNIIGLALSSMLPYAVPFESVRLYPPPSLVDSLSEVRPSWGISAVLACNDELDSFTGAIVGLCCEPDASEITFNIVNCIAGCGVPVLPCAGLGIIRSIDHERRTFYVLTPVHPNLLSGVSSFVGGNVSLPLECVYRGIYSDSFPHLSFGQVAVNLGLGSEVMKSRNHLGRKK